MSNRVIYIDVLRIIATLAVVLLHAAALYWVDLPIESLNWLVLTIYDSLVRWCVPIFVMISGVFFLQQKGDLLDYKSAYKAILQKNVLRIATALIIWGEFYGFYFMLRKYLIKGISPTFADFIDMQLKIIFGIPFYHLWFLYLIIGLYILSPLLRIFVANAGKKGLEIALFMFMVFGCTLSLANALFRLFEYKFSFYFPLPEFSGYVGYFIAGYYFATYDLSQKSKKILYFLGILSIIITAVGTYFLSFYAKQAVGIFYEYITTTTMFSAFALFVFVKSCFSNKKISNSFEQKISAFGGITFGIYLLHVLFLESYKWIGFEIKNALIDVIILFFMALIPSVLIVYLISKIPMIKKFAI